MKNSERYQALWLDSLLPVIEAGQLETVDVATRPRVGGRIDLYPHPGHSPDHAALVLAAGDDYACFSGDLPHSRSSLPIRAVEFSVLRRSPAGRKSRDGR